MRTVLIVLAAMLIGMTTQARLGETEAQLIERFGKPLDRVGVKPPADGKGYIWEVGDSHTTAWLFNGQCAWIEYRTKFNKPELTPIEVKGILEANAAGFGWSQWKPGSKVWIRSDKQAVAEVEERKVTIYDTAFAKAVKAATDKAIADIEAERAARKAEELKRREERQAAGGQTAPAAPAPRSSKF